MSTVVWGIRYRGTQLGPVCAGFCAENAQPSQTCESLRRKRACAIFQHRDAGPSFPSPATLVGPGWVAPMQAPGPAPWIPYTHNYKRHAGEEGGDPGEWAMGPYGPVPVRLLHYPMATPASVIAVMVDILEKS